MGFIHLHDFNVVLLGKQGWRLLTKLDSLVARIYKARYYPQENFLNAKVGGSPIFVWRSVMEARNLIKQGIACRVGNGESINMLDDPWLPDVSNPHVQSRNEALQGKPGHL